MPDGQTIVLIPEGMEALQAVVRLLVALVLGAALGLEREKKRRAAGLRTHMLVALGAALFTLVPFQATGPESLNHIGKGIAAGIGFLGAGAILKRGSRDHKQIEGLTTAAGIWLTAAVGLAAGAGWILPAVTGTVLALITLYVVSFLDVKEETGDDRSDRGGSDG